MLVNEDPESQLPGYMKAATQAAIHEKRVQAMAKQVRVAQCKRYTRVVVRARWWTLAGRTP